MPTPDMITEDGTMFDFKLSQLHHEQRDALMRMYTEGHPLFELNERENPKLAPIDRLSQRMHKALSTGAEDKSALTKEMLTRMCMQMIGQAEPRGPAPRMVFPVDLPKKTKKNKARLIHEDRGSPSGIVLKHDVVTETAGVATAVASFNAYHILAWLFTLPE